MILQEYYLLYHTSNEKNYVKLIEPYLNNNKLVPIQLHRT
jgi:hypothetical protein